MAPDTSHLAQLLVSSSKGFSGSAARSFLAAYPNIESGTGSGAFELWKLHFEERLGDLAAALAFEAPNIFAAGASWSRSALEARDGDVDSFLRALAALREELMQRLPEGSPDVIEPFFDEAASALHTPATELPSGGELLLGHRALEFLQFTFEGRTREAANLLLASHSEGTSLIDLFEEVVIPAQREIGELWHRGEVNVAEEHLATLTTQKAIAVLAHHAEGAPDNGRLVLTSAVTGDAHELGLRLLCAVFEGSGWRAINLGADVPRLDLLQALQVFEADLLVLSATLSPQLLSIQHTIAAIRQQSLTPNMRILVGGRAFRLGEDLWTRVGADGWAPSLREAVPAAERLLV